MLIYLNNLYYIFNTFYRNVAAFNIKRLHNSWHNLVIYDAALLTKLVVFNIRICWNINLAGPAGFVSIPLLDLRRFGI